MHRRRGSGTVVRSLEPQAEMAEALDIDVGASAMTIVRRYVGNRDRTFEVSVSAHPEGRFTYAMDLEREWGVRG
tara:strand:- start:1370 stop:1591 length:222 start_codon:yes stop_codon:yes gene_type:complete